MLPAALNPRLLGFPYPISPRIWLKYWGTQLLTLLNSPGTQGGSGTEFGVNCPDGKTISPGTWRYAWLPSTKKFDQMLAPGRSLFRLPKRCVRYRALALMRPLIVS